MATANSSTTSETNQILDIQSESFTDKVHMKLAHVAAILDCLYALACQDIEKGMELGLGAGSLSSSLDLALRQIDEAQSLLMEVK
ncbi:MULTISPECIES: hypothetical protein [unclassified Methylophilus]|uniref:hypothetical protein n=1 Tax=unclassified Methylophilus TaxID=2630143 RepID=UPI00036E2B02|nr:MULTISPECIES: hypothetical protein [unclassified Methylophilus]